MANQHTKKKAAAKKKPVKKPAAPAVDNAIRNDAEGRAVISELFSNAIARNLTVARAPLMNKADEKAKHQPHFTLLPSDNFTPVLVQAWINMAVNHNVPEEKLLEARAILKRITDWRTAHPTACKTPD